MMKENPGLYEYLRTRRFTNKSGNDFGYEPYDEQHEEYNKKGIRADLLEYWHNSKSDPEFDIKDFYESLLKCDY